MVARSHKGQAQTPFNGDSKEYIVLKRGHCPWLLREIGLLGLCSKQGAEMQASSLNTVLHNDIAVTVCQLIDYKHFVNQISPFHSYENKNL